MKTICLLLFIFSGFACFAQPCGNFTKYYYGDTVTVCGRVDKSFVVSTMSSDKDSVIVNGKVLRRATNLVQINLQMPISVTTKKPVRDVRLDITENNVFGFEIIDSKKLLPDSLKSAQKELKGIFHHADVAHPYSSKVWFDLVEVK